MLTRLALPWLPPITPEVRRPARGRRACASRPVRQRGGGTGTTGHDRGLGRLPSKRAVTWYWWACTIDGVYEGTHAWSEAELRHELDRAGQFPCWEDFERETIQRPLEELHAYTDFRVHYEVQRRREKIVAVRFKIEKPQTAKA